MPLRQMPNGEYVDVPADITPEGFAKIAAQFKAPSGSSRDGSVTVSLPNADEARAKEDSDYVAGAVGNLRGASGGGIGGRIARSAENIAHNVSLGADDVVSAAGDAVTAGALNAVKKGDIGEIGRRFSNNRAALRKYRDENHQEHPWESLAGDVAGIFANPVGAETGLAKAAGAGANILSKVPAVGQYADDAVKIAQGIKASKLGRTIGKIGNSTIGVGARTGFNQGAVTSLMDHGDAGDALHEGIVGGLTGAAASALLRGGSSVYRTVQNHAPEQAKRVAMERVAALLGRSENPLTKQPYTPESMVTELREGALGGSNGIVADLIPEGQGWLSHLAKQPGNNAASHAINAAEERMATAPDRFDARVRQILKIDKTAPDAYDSKKAIEAARKAKGQIDYSPDVMNRQLAWSDELDDLFKSSEAIKDALPGAEKLMRLDRADPRQLAFANSGDPSKGLMQQVPSIGTMQYIKQSLDDLIGAAMKSGDTNAARIYSKENRALKDAISNVHPELMEANAAQRDAFERLNSTDLGTKILDHLKAGRSREVLDMIRDPKIKPDDLKLGFADGLLNLRERGGDPVVIMRSFMRSDRQRAVLQRMFGGTKPLNEFEQFMRRETRAMRTDKMVASGRQMQANLLKDPGQGGTGEAFGDIVKSAGQGMAFGGPIGAASRLTRQVDKWGKSVSPAAKAELTRVLSGTGEEVKKGIARSKAYQRILERKLRRAAVNAGKMPGALVNGYSEE